VLSQVTSQGVGESLFCVHTKVGIVAVNVGDGDGGHSGQFLSFVSLDYIHSIAHGNAFVKGFFQKK
jgi:hypothetical protein